MKWKTKAFIQCMLAQMPEGKRLYYLGHRFAGRLRHFSVESKLNYGMKILKSFRKSRDTMENLHTVEFGTGWSPLIPLLFWLYGQKRCDTYDVSRLLNRSLTVKSAKKLLAVSDRSDLFYDKARKEQLQALVNSDVSCSEFLSHCNIHYHAPVDTANTGLADKTVDLLYSINVLEHVPEIEIHRLFREAYQILRPHGNMIHLIDLSDHFSHADSSIGYLNFLQFSESEFLKYNNYFCFQNRLRAPSYRQIFKLHKFEIVKYQAETGKNVLSQFPIMIHDDFNKFSSEELCTHRLLVGGIKL